MWDLELSGQVIPGGYEPTIFTPKEARLVKVISTIDPKTRNNVLGSLGNFLVAKNKKRIPANANSKGGQVSLVNMH